MLDLGFGYSSCTIVLKSIHSFIWIALVIAKQTWAPMKNITISSVDQIQIINSTLEKFDHDWKEKQSLASVYQYWKKIIIFDNHNHALYYRAQYLLSSNQQLPVIHIDQHSDMTSPTDWNSHLPHTTTQDREHIAYHIADIGSFIVPALEWWLISHCEQIRSETKLLEFPIPNHPFILDIDLDFRAPEMINDYCDQTLEKTRNLITNASFITIATSPWYIDQLLALNILNQLLV